jgi:Signal transduction histidine kinase
LCNFKPNRLKDEFLATLSHELRTPLNAILGWSQVLRSRRYTEATLARALEAIDRQARVQTQLVEDLLDVSRVIQGKLCLKVGWFDMVNAIAVAVNSVSLAAESKSIAVKSKLDRGFGLMWGDAQRLQQVVLNLLTNAIKFTPAHGEVEIELSAVALNQECARAHHVVIRVRDTGKGINPDFLPYVFDRFRQADGSITRAHSGLGLGLAIVRHLVELHGGTVCAESPGEGKGATFTVTLPLKQPKSQKLQLRGERNFEET